jgi:hypothetical protein
MQLKQNINSETNLYFNIGTVSKNCHSEVVEYLPNALKSTKLKDLIIFRALAKIAFME